MGQRPAGAANVFAEHTAAKPFYMDDAFDLPVVQARLGLLKRCGAASCRRRLARAYAAARPLSHAPLASADLRLPIRVHYDAVP
jgi:hypothetical protein